VSDVATPLMTIFFFEIQRQRFQALLKSNLLHGKYSMKAENSYFTHRKNNLKKKSVYLREIE
jgi:hypothetical protein